MKYDISKRCLVVISYYDKRPVWPLYALVESLSKYAPDDAFDACVVVNQTDKPRLNPKRLAPAILHYRENTGMNIGAWNHGWKQNPGYRDYLFLQDECYLIDSGWLHAFRARNAEIGGGLLGESLNRSWDAPWQILRGKQAAISMPGHFINGHPANRVDVYLDFMSRSKIDPGNTGQHLRSLIWYAEASLLSKIGGFPIGSNYGECIGAEIAVSRKVISHGMAIDQVSQEPFRFFRHLEWVQLKKGGPYIHASSLPLFHRIRRKAGLFFTGLKVSLFNAGPAFGMITIHKWPGFRKDKLHG